MLLQERCKLPAKPASLPEKKVNLPSRYRVVTDREKGRCRCIVQRTLADRQWVELSWRHTGLTYRYE